MRTLTKTRWARRAALVLGALSAIGALQVTTAGPAAAVPGLIKVMEVSPRSDAPDPTKTVHADCPAGHVVVGGGGWANDQSRVVRLTQLRPNPNGAGLDMFIASAEAPPGWPGSWDLYAFALCAPTLSVPGYQVIPEAQTTSDTFVADAVGCPSGKLALSAGARLTNADNQVGLQLVRTSGPMDIARATAREDADGYNGNWTLTTYVVCANAAPGQHVDNRVTEQAHGTTSCTDVNGQDTLVHGAGGGGSLTDSGLTWLQAVYPEENRSGVFVAMTSTPPSGGLVVHAVCAH